MRNLDPEPLSSINFLRERGTDTRATQTRKFPAWRFYIHSFALELCLHPLMSGTFLTDRQRAAESSFSINRELQEAGHLEKETQLLSWGDQDWKEARRPTDCLV